MNWGLGLELLLTFGTAIISVYFTKREPKEQRGTHFLSAPGHRAAWVKFAQELGGTLDRLEGRLDGEYEGHPVSMKLPTSYLGGAAEVMLMPRRRLPELHVVPRRWWQPGSGSDEDQLPAELRAFVAEHEIELKTSPAGIVCTLPHCELFVVRELLSHLVQLAASRGAYRRSAQSLLSA